MLRTPQMRRHKADTIERETEWAEEGEEVRVRAFQADLLSAIQLVHKKAKES